MLVTFPSPGNDPALHQRLQRLEQALAFSLDALDSLFVKLEQKLGPGFVTSDLQAIIADPVDHAPKLDTIDELIRTGQHPAAARDIRELFRVTWDAAHALSKTWHQYSREQLLRSVRLARFMSRLEARPDSP